MASQNTSAGDSEWSDANSLLHKMWLLQKANNTFFKQKDKLSLCREAVIAAAEHLALGRAGIWLQDDASGSYQGTWGIDEKGILRNESHRIRDAQNLEKQFMGIEETHPGVRIEHDVDLFNDHIEKVGFGERLVVPLGYVHDYIGVLSVDNLLTGHAYDKDDMGLLRLLATSLTEHLIRINQSVILIESEKRLKKHVQQLRLLQDISDKLCLVGSVDNLCRSAVEMAHHVLGFSRVSIWFCDDEPGMIRGSYGISERGTLRDERDSCHYAKAELMLKVLREGAHLAVKSNTPLLDYQGVEVGKGTHVAAALWNGNKIIGALSCDDLLRPGSLDDDGSEIVRMFASTLGHLISTVKSNEAHRISEERLRLVLESANEGINICERVGGKRRLVLCNKRFIEMSGRSYEELKACDDLNKLVKCHELQHYREDNYEIDLLHKRGVSSWLRPDGAENYFDWTVSQIEQNGKHYVIGVDRDITDEIREKQLRDKLETQVLQSQKLESIGLLAGGIAHDFNNLLMGIMGHADLALLNLPPDSPAYESLEEICNTARRSADLAQQMLAYSGQKPLTLNNVFLNDLIKEMEKLLAVSVSKSVVLHYDLKEGLQCISGDATQIRQVVMNLVINASEAIGDRSGEINISTENCELNNTDLLNMVIGEGLEPGRYVCLRVRDNGEGMDTDTVLRIFDPFFTTKFTGRGLGLAAVLGIIRSHQSGMRVLSTEGEGTEFEIYFPVSKRYDSLQDECLTDIQIDTKLPSGKILVVDDEEIVRKIAMKMLGALGFKAILASDGREGVNLFREHADELLCVLLDMTMPHMSGEEAFIEMQKLRPHIPVILSTGYSDHEIKPRFEVGALAGILKKPYRLDYLHEMLKQVLKIKDKPDGGRKDERDL